MTDERILAFRDALADGDDPAALDRFSAFGDALSEQATRARAGQTLARAVIARTDDADVEAAAQRYLKAANDARQGRIRVEGEFFLYTQDGPAATDVADTVDELIAAGGDLRDAEAELREAATEADVDLPPQVAVFGPEDLSVPAGETARGEYTVANVGTVSLSGLSVSADAEDLDPDVDPASVGSLAPGEAASVTVATPTDEAGTFDLTLAADGDDAGDDLGVVVDVLGPADYVETARAAVREAIDRLERVEENADGDVGGVEGLLETLREIDDRLGRILDRLEEDTPPGTAVANRIGAAINALGAVLNQLDALEGGSLTARQTAVVGYDARDAIDDLSKARDLVDGGGPGGGKGGSGGEGGSGGKAAGG